MTPCKKMRMVLLVVATSVASTFGWHPLYNWALADEALDQVDVKIEAKEWVDDIGDSLSVETKSGFEKPDYTIEKSASHVDGTIEMVELNNPEVVESNSIGTCHWTLDSNGRLYVFPEDGLSGLLPNEWDWWGLTTESVVSVDFAPGVSAGTSLANMFVGPNNGSEHRFTSLESVDFTNLDTSDVTDMSGMFFGCTSLQHLDLTSLDTTNVTDMRGLFSYCSSLESLDLSSFDTSSVEDMGSMFFDCNSLSSLDLSSFDTSSVKAMDYMFYSCHSLSSIDLSNFDTSHVTRMGSMFSCCSSLESLDLSPFDTSSATDISSLFSGCSSLRSVDLSPLNTSRVTYMNNLFCDCTSLQSIDLSPLDISNVRNMSCLFSGCSSLESVEMYGLNTSRVLNMSAMFLGCSSLTSLDLSSFDTSRVTDMSSMFKDCTSLESVDLSSFDTTNVSEMGSMFNGCSSLSTLDISSFRIQRVVSMRSMFSGSKTSTLVVGDGWRPMGKYSSDSPQPTSQCGQWWSTNGRRWVGADELMQSSGSANTYVSSVDLSDAEVELADEVAWPGTMATPQVTVRLGSALIVLSEGEDYDVFFHDSDAIGTATATVKGKGDYYGSVVSQFEIVPADISVAAVSEIVATPKTGSALTPKPEVWHGTNLLVEGTDYDLTYSGNVEPGTATVTIAGKGNYTGSKTVEFEVLPNDISFATISGVPVQVWTGKPITPAFAITIGSVVLKEGIDYSLSYSNNVEPGTATIIITGIGSYKGTRTVEFEISPKSGAWKQSGSRWWYRYEDGTYPKSEIVEIDGAKYGFDASGWMQTGWAKHGGQWHYFASSGKMATGWVKSGSSWYYMDRETGAMHTGWLDDGGARYYMRASGAMGTGWLQVGGKWHYFASSGKMATGWVKSGSSWYFMDRETGAMATGWIDDGGKTYWLKSGGSMATGWQKIGGEWYYFSSGGVMARSKWVQKYYYVDADGVMMESGITPDGYRIVNGKWDGKGKVA